MKIPYILEYKSSESGEWQKIKNSKKNVPISNVPTKQELVDGLLVSAGATYYYRLTIKLEDLSNVNQSQDLNAKLTTKFTLDEGKKINKMIARSSANSKEKIWSHSSNITRIVFENTLEPKNNATFIYDLSIDEDGSIMSYVVPTEEDNSKYVVYIQADGKIYANENSVHFFSNFTNLESIDGLENFDTSDVIDMSSMFSYCSSLTYLDINNFDTSNTTNMQGMFWGCSSLTSLDLSNFDTSKVTSIAEMFAGCTSLTMLNLNNFDTSNVTNMSYMFAGCNSLTSLDLSNFNTKKITSMDGIFLQCSNLTSLNLSNFNISNVTSSLEMFTTISSSIKITVHNDSLKQWIINASDSPKLTDSNFIIA